ncbi:MAG: SWIM zinc finger family protein, partial [Arenimonas sp.]
MSLPDFTQDDILRWFGPREIEKARSYIDAVTGIAMQTNFISARVMGKAPRPYNVEIEFDLDRKGKLAIATHCTCPVGWQCKHTAATLLAYLSRQKQPQKINPVLLTWLANFRQSHENSHSLKKPKKKPEVLFYCLVPYPGNGLRLRFLKAKVDDNGDIVK